MCGSCAHLHEARDRHGQVLYRLYLHWDRSERRVVVLAGGAKRNSTALPESFYAGPAGLAATLSHRPPPLATADDVLRLALSVSE